LTQRSAATKSSAVGVFLLLNAVITSPAISPAAAAGLGWATLRTATQLVWSSPSYWAICGVSVAGWIGGFSEALSETARPRTGPASRPAPRRW